MPLAKKEPWRCKHRIARGKNRDTRCKKKIIDQNGYCKAHGPMHKQTGPKTKEGKEASSKATAAVSIKGGFYAKNYATPEMVRLIHDAADEQGDLRNLIADTIARRQLVVRELYRREIGETDGFEEHIKELERKGQHLVRLNKKGEEVPSGVEGEDFRVSELKQKTQHSRASLATLHNLIDMHSGRIASLEKDQLHLMQGENKTDDVNEAAKEISTAVREMINLTGGGVNGGLNRVDPPDKSKNGNGSKPNGSG